MIETKLILIDGIPGAGKSITAQFIARQLEKNGIKTRIYNETDNNHPLDHNYDITDETEYLNEYLKRYHEIWHSFSKMIENDNCVYIIESFLYQKVLYSVFDHNFDRQILKEFSHMLLSTVRMHNPVIIYFYQANVASMMKLNYQRRGTAWKQWFTSLPINSLYCMKHDLSGEAGAIKFMDDFQNFEMELFNESTFRKIKIETSAQDWSNYQQNIANLLEISLVEENLFDESFIRYCGNFNGIIIHINNNRLCMDGFWTNLTLVPLKDNEFQIEGFPIVLKFITDENDEINSFKIIKSLTIYREGGVYFKILPIELNISELEKFCGEYLCKENGYLRKIYIKDSNKLFYRHDENSESQLIPVSESRLVMKVDIENKLDFEFINNDHQFKFQILGDNPKVSLFKKVQVKELKP